MKKRLVFCLLALLLCSCAAAQETTGTTLPSVNNDFTFPEGASSLAIVEPFEEKYDWGISLSVKDVTANGLTLVCEQSGGDAAGELSTGSFYQLDIQQDGQWKAAETLPLEGELAWTAEAWIVFPESSNEWSVDWTWLYGELAPGTYRISKEFMDWRQPGEFDFQMLSTEFEVK